MDPAQACPRCGTSRIANAPAGLCPRCLLGHGLLAGQEAGPEAESGDAGGALTGRWSRSRHSGVLSVVDQAIGPVPRVLGRERPEAREERGSHRSEVSYIRVHGAREGIRPRHRIMSMRGR